MPVEERTLFVVSLPRLTALSLTNSITHSITNGFIVMDLFVSCSKLSLFTSLIRVGHGGKHVTKITNFSFDNDHGKAFMFI